jgi:hypothetical protein
MSLHVLKTYVPTIACAFEMYLFPLPLTRFLFYRPWLCVSWVMDFPHETGTSYQSQASSFFSFSFLCSSMQTIVLVSVLSALLRIMASDDSFGKFKLFFRINWTVSLIEPNYLDIPPPPYRLDTHRPPCQYYLHNTYHFHSF